MINVTPVERTSFKMLVLDLDGTILNDKKEIMPENKNAIQEIKRKNPETLICIATGRTYTTSIQFIRDIGADFLIARDGEVIYSGFDNKNYTFKKVFNKSELDRAAIYNKTIKPLKKVLCKSKTPMIKLWSKLSALKYKIKSGILLKKTKTSGLDSIITHIKYLEKNRDNIKISKRSPFGTEKAIGPFSAHKGKALIYILEQLRKKGIYINRAEVAIVGNNSNDLEMLKLEGCQSFCPSNAIEQIKDLDNVYQLKGNNNDPWIKELLEHYGNTTNTTGIPLKKFEARAKRNFPYPNTASISTNPQTKRHISMPIK